MWTGIRRDTAAVDGDGLQDLVNVSHYIDGEMTRRPGKAFRSATGAISMIAWRDTKDNNEEWIIKQTSSGDIISGKIGTATANTLDNIPAATTAGSFVAFNGVLYFFHPSADGIAIESGDNASLVSSIGIAAPTSAMGAPTQGAGTTTPGVHLLRYRYYNSSLGYFSNPSDPVTVTVTDGTDGQLTFTVAASGGSADIVGSANTRCDKIIVEMTLASGQQFYDVAYIDNGSTSNVVVSMEDAVLEQQLRRAFGLDTGSAPAPRLAHATIHRGRMFGIDATNRFTLHWSSPGNPEGFDTTAQSRKVFGNTGDVPVALYSVFEDLYIFGQRSMAKLRYNVEPGLGQLDVIDESGCGLWNPRCLVVADGISYGFGRNGAWVIPAGVPRRISRPVDEILSDIDADYADLFHACFDPDERVINFWYVETGNTTATTSLRYDIDRRIWSRATYQTPITASTVAIGTRGDLIATVSDGAYCWSLEQGVFDGVPRGTNAVATSASGSTTTVLQVNETVSSDLAGAYITNRTSGETRLITASTSSTITVGSAFSGAPADGTEFWIGAFEMFFEPKWSSVANGRNKTRPRKYELTAIPATTGTDGAFRLYQNFSDTPATYTALDTDLFANGVTVTDAATSVAFNTNGGDEADGYLTIPLPSDWCRTIKGTLTFSKPAGTLRIVDAGFVVERGDSAPVMDE